MPDLIDRAWLLQYGRTKPISEAIPEFKQMSHEEQQGAIKMARGWLRIISKAPAADAEPVVHARWEEYSKVLGFLRCSHCKDCYVDKDWPKGSKWKYCPHCGAKMDEEETDGKV